MKRVNMAFPEKLKEALNKEQAKRMMKTGKKTPQHILVSLLVAERLALDLTEDDLKEIKNTTRKRTKKESV